MKPKSGLMDSLIQFTLYIKDLVKGAKTGKEKKNKERKKPHHPLSLARNWVMSYSSAYWDWSHRSSNPFSIDFRPLPPPFDFDPLLGSLLDPLDSSAPCSTDDEKYKIWWQGFQCTKKLVTVQDKVLVYSAFCLKAPGLYQIWATSTQG